MLEDRARQRVWRLFRIGIFCQLVLVSTCRGFVQELALTRQWQQYQAAIAAQPKLSSSTTTQLYARQPQPIKPPRFVQKAHSKQKNSGNRKEDPSTLSTTDFKSNSLPKVKQGKNLPFDTEQSIEDLESRLMKRWGTLEASQTDKQRINNKKNKKNNKTTLNPFQQPVLDPWEPESRQKHVVREFYDEDDEGFEIIELDEDDEDDDFDWETAEWDDGDDEDDNADRRMKISHLISPKPVGGRGTFTNDSTRGVPSASSSYFFNPNKQQIEEAPAPKSNKPKPVSAEKTNGVDTRPLTKERSQKAPLATPIFDDNGNEILLTVEEAQRQFEKIADNVEVVEAMMDEDEAPIVAYQQTSQPSWTEIGITSDILQQNLNAMYCSTPLAVQQKTIPHALTGNDVLVGTYTGSGKSLSFLTPLIQRLLWQEEDPGLTAIIVAPGRELASQIVSVARQLLEDTPFSVQMAIGGTTFSRNLEQIRKRKPNILVGTPGRIAELVVGKPGEKSGRLKIGNLQTLVLDEFDALLEYKPHRDPTRAIIQALQRRHGDALQSILCSATASDLMDSPKVTEYLRDGFATAMADDDDVFVTGTKAKRPQVSRTVLHGVVHVPHRRFALDTIRRILHTEPIPQQILIFVESARKVDIVVDKLAQQGIVAAPLHGGKGSDKMDRAEVSKALREGYVGIVVATELAARGLDAPLLTHVINLDLPTDASHYAHRAGRCGRGGRPGVVINITTGPQERKVPQRFADALGIEMHTVEARQGKLLLVDPATQTLDV